MGKSDEKKRVNNEIDRDLPDGVKNAKNKKRNIDVSLDGEFGNDYLVNGSS